MSTVVPMPETPTYEVPKEFMIKVEALEKLFKKVTGTVPVIAYGSTRVTSKVVTVNFPRKFSRTPIVIAFYSIPGEKVKVTPISFPKIPSIKIPAISIKAPSIKGITFTPKLPEIEVPPPPEVKVSLVTAIPKVNINLPSVPKVPTISSSYINKMLPAFSISIPKVSRPDFRYKISKRMKEETEDRLKNFLGDWGWANWIRDNIVKAFSSISWYWGFIIGMMLNLFWDTVIKPQIDNIQNTINTAIKKAFDRARSELGKQLQMLISKINGVVDNVNQVLSQFRKNIIRGINDSVNMAVRNVNDRIKDINDKLTTLSNAAYGYATYLSDKVNKQFASYSLEVTSVLNNYKDSVNFAFKDLSKKLSNGINEAFKLVRDSFNSSSEAFTRDINNRMRTFANTLNRVIDILLVMSGFVDGKTYSVSEPTEVSPEGFRVKVAKTGGTLFWIAIEVR